MIRFSKKHAPRDSCRRGENFATTQQKTPTSHTHSWVGVARNIISTVGVFAFGVGCTERE